MDGKEAAGDLELKGIEDTHRCCEVEPSFEFWIKLTVNCQYTLYVLYVIVGVRVLSVYAHLKTFEQLLEINISAVIVAETLGLMVERHRPK